MIPFNFKYYKPETIVEAVNLYESLKLKGEKVIYYGGGTEFISMARMNNVYADSVIDIKGISDCNVYELKNGILSIGSAVSLTKIAEKNLFPLLSLAVARIADHTIQDKITLGGNIRGTIIYKEAVLPLLIADADIVLSDNKGKRKVPLNSVFNRTLQLKEGELIVSVEIKAKYLSQPYVHVKRTKNEKIDYPLITLTALNDEQEIKIAFSGMCNFPFRSTYIERTINDKSISRDERADKILNYIPGKILTDVSGTAEYREFVLKTMLEEVLDKLEGVVSC